MQTTKNRSLQSFRRVRDWGKNHDGFLQAAPTVVHTFFTSLDGVINRIEINAVTQVAAHQSSTREATDADQRRNAVRNAMRPISQVARTLRGQVFGISAIPTMPGKNADNEHLVIAANSMAQNATMLQSTLIDHGLAPDCIETLTAAAEALKSSIDARGSAKAKAIGARDGIRADLKEGVKLVSLLDAALSTLLKDDHVNFASWKNAKRVTIKGVQGIATASITPGAATPAVPTTPIATPAAPAIPRAA
jgi:hypothetical protein